MVSSVPFKLNAWPLRSGSSISCFDCVFEGNEASWGGGAIVSGGAHQFTVKTNDAPSPPPFLRTEYSTTKQSRRISSGAS